MNEAQAPKATWTLQPDEPVFAGHFPGRPLLPGGMLLDWAITAYAGAHGAPTSAFSVRQARFLAPARPGAALTIETHRDRRGRHRLQVTATTREGESECLLDMLIEEASPGIGGSHT